MILVWALLSISGIICFFQEIFVVVYIVAVINVADQLREVYLGRQNNLVTMMIALLGGFIFYTQSSYTIWQCLSLALCIEMLVMNVIASAVMFLLYWFPRKGTEGEHTNGKPRNKWKMGCIALSALSVILLAALVTGGIYIADLRDALDQLETDYTIMEGKLDAYQTSLEKVRTERNQYRDIAEFVDSYVVFVTGSGEKYHRFNCSYFQNNSQEFYVFNSNYAKSLGYEPCLACNPPQ